MAVFLNPSSLFVLTLLTASASAALMGVVTWNRCRATHDPDLPTRQPDNTATILIIDHCNITEFHSNSFYGYPSLTTISADSNELETVDQAVFRTVPKLIFLVLNQNKFTEVPVCDRPFFPNLRTLELSSNLLTHIRKRAFSECTDLRLINLASNSIEYIHPDVFRPLRHLGLLYLNNNKLTYIPDAMFINNINLRLVTVADNQLSRMSCNFISELKRVAVRLHGFYFKGNPWNCGTLLGILEDAKRSGVNYYDREYYSPYNDTELAGICKNLLP